MSETTVDDSGDDPLEPVRQMVREMIRQKQGLIRSSQEAEAAAASRAARLARESQEQLAELHQLELALKRLDGEGREE